MPDHRPAMTTGTLYAALLRGCPSCKSKKQMGFYAGPHGGASQNIMCRDPDCRMEFNICEAIEWADQTGVANQERFGFFRRFGLWRPAQ